MDKVVVRQDSEFRAEVLAQSEGDKKLVEVSQIYELSPYTMMLASLGLCTGIVVHTYAHHHDIDLELAEIAATYHRDERGGGRGYDEWIEEKVDFEGDLSPADRERLARVAHHCSIRKMLESGIEVRAA